jgi:diguanylate cyclase (GGDEF)-like protein/putative nucleotidyltransferase with HDIG domain
MESLMSLNRRAQLYWAFVVILGVAGAVTVIGGTRYGHDLNLLLWIVVAAAVAGFKIRLPGILGTLSMNYVIILVVLMNLDVGAGMIVALTSTLAQCLIHSQARPRWFQVLFSVAGVPLPVLTANLALHCPYMERAGAFGCVALLAASIVYFLTNTISVAGIISLTSQRSLFETWKTSYLWTSPQYLVGGAIAWVVHLLNKDMGWGSILVAAPPLYLLYRSYTTYLGRIQEQQGHLAEMAALHLRTIETLALAIDAKDDTTAAHLRRVQIYAAGIGKELNLSPAEMQALHAAALLHDVGKLAVPEYIISKPGKLTPEEFEKMKVHPVVGAEILDRVNFPYPVVPIVLSHHEKYDGTGYPEGLIGDQIPIGARILSAVDCLDALASNRQYRQAVPLDEAMEIVASQAGKAFDPKVVAILQNKYRDLEQEAKSHTADRTRLSTHIKIERGLAPATGFAPAKALPVTEPPAENDFSRSIANARREIQLLTEVINDLGNSLSLDDTLALLAVRLFKAVKHDAIAVYLLREGRLIPRFVKGESYRLFSSLQIPVGQGLSGWVAENDKAIVNANPAAEPGYLNDPRLVTPLRSAIAIPLRSPDRMVGVLTLYSLAAEAFSADHYRLLLAIAPKAAHAIENSLRFERAANAADTDELTGLANGRFLFSHLAKEVVKYAETDNSFAVIVMDLDGFKQANDQFGHLAGNRILQAIARHLRRNTRSGDVVARLGGDEFVVVMNQSPQNVTEYIGHINQIAGRLEAEVNCHAMVSISAGVARYPEDGLDAETLLERADERMYEVKRRKQIAREVRKVTSAVA